MIKLNIMKNKTVVLCALSLVLFACNNAGKDSVEKADSANEAKYDSADNSVNVPAATISTDEETSSFLVKAATMECLKCQRWNV